MMTLLARIDDILRRRQAVQSRPSASACCWMVGCIAAFGMIYGAVMGAFGGVCGDRLWQVVYSAVKVPLLLLGTSLIAWPSFFVLNTLVGLRHDFARATTALMAAQAGLAVVLASLAPLTLVWYASSGDYGGALRFNGMMFAVACLAGQWLLRDHYRLLIAARRQAPVDVLDVAGDLRVRRHSNGLGLAAVRRRSRLARPVLPARQMGECVSCRRTADLRHGDAMMQTGEMPPTRWTAMGRLRSLARLLRWFSLDVRIIRRTIAKGMMPKTPNEQSMSCQKSGMPRIGPQINASGITRTQAIMPNFDDPYVADRISQRPEEGDGNDNVGERQPVGAVGEKWIVAAGGFNTVANVRQPVGQARKRGSDGGAIAEPGCQQPHFPKERKGRESAQKKSDNEEA